MIVLDYDNFDSEIIAVEQPEESEFTVEGFLSDANKDIEHCRDMIKYHLEMAAKYEGRIKRTELQKAELLKELNIE